MDFIDLKAQQARIRANIDARIHTVLDHGHYIMGPEVAELEARLCAFTGAKHCISCASGTDALLMPLMAWGVGSGDAVFMPPFTFFATAEMPALLGATPIFVDIDPKTYNMRPDLLEKAIKAVLAQDTRIYPLPQSALAMPLRPKVVIPVDLFGQPAQYEALLPLAARYGLKVLEDAAQAFGAVRHGMKTCALGCHASTTSFFPAKPLGCYGDGGAIFTEDDDLAHILRSIRIHGKGSDKYDNVRIGINGRLDTLQAAILLVKMDIFADEIAQRQTVAAWYAEHLHTITGITLPHIEAGCVSAWAQYCIVLPLGMRDAIASALKACGIPTNVYYPRGQHELSVFDALGYAPEHMPAACALSQRILALPFHPYMRQADVQRVALALKEALA